MNETTRTNTRHKKPQTEDTHTTKSFVTIPFSLFSDYKPAAVPAAQQALVQVPAITPVLLPKVVDVTAITGQQINGPVTSWQTPDGPFNVEHLAGMSPNGDLLVFFWSPRQDWTAVNVSQITGQKIVSPVTSWQTRIGDLNFEHLAGINSNGHLLVFIWSPDKNWRAIDVTQKTGQRITSAVTSWQTPDGPFNVEHLSGMSPNGDLLVFFLRSQEQPEWQNVGVVNVSQKAGQQINGPVTSWQTPDGPFNVEHLAGMSPNGDLLVFFWSPRQDWTAVNVTSITGQRIASLVTSWQTPDGPFNVEHLAGMSPNGDLLVFFWSPRQDWTAVNVSQITGQKIVSPVTSWVINNVEHLAGYASDSSLYSFFWSSDRNWQAVNLSLMTGQKVTTPVTNWQTPDGPRIVEHLAGRSQDGHLLVFFWSPGGIYTVHIQAVKVADDDGGRETSITADQVKQWIHKANEVYAVGGIQFLFNPNGPNADWLPVLRNTLINKMYGEDAPDWIQSRDEANAVAARYSDKMTIFFRYGPGPGPTGGGFSSTTYNFVAMPGFSVTVVCGHQNLGLLAHESGHYMGLSHTFRFIFGSIAEAEGYFSSHNNDPASFDGDGLSDTPPDPFINTPDIACQHTISITLTGVQLVLPRNNIMSYYDEEGKTISPQQINIVRQTLDSRAQNNGLSIGKP